MEDEMEHGICNVIYLNSDIRRDRFLQSADDISSMEWESDVLAKNTKLLLDVFGDVHLCRTSKACIEQWLELQDTSLIDIKPTLILIQTPHDDRFLETSRSSTSCPQSPTSTNDEGIDGNKDRNLYGLEMLDRIVSEASIRSLSKLIIPVSIVDFPSPDIADEADNTPGVFHDERKCRENSHQRRKARDHYHVANRRRLLKQCLDLGATDIISSPMNGQGVTNLQVHVQRVRRDAARSRASLIEVHRGRKRSWVGLTGEKPFAYLREAMITNLMNQICQIETEIYESPCNYNISVPPERRIAAMHSVGKWNFDAHSLSEDELIIAASAIFNHALSMPELEKWCLSTDEMVNFLIACRAAYNDFVPYHNFRHVVDVLQATFSFLLEIGALPPFPQLDGTIPPPPKKSPAAELLTPFESLTLLITAIGHDVGHPGVNNGFLVTLNAPLAQLYNDRSVLESFHCAAYSQILRRHWPVAFEDGKMRNLMIGSILSTDMGLHFDYMTKMGNFQDKLRNGPPIECWDGRTMQEQKALLCALLMKCADVSNVARKHKIALNWMHTLSDEFSRQDSMEKKVNIPTSLMAPPRCDMVSLSRAQLGFMNLFAIPLFEGVADLLPAMTYCVDELQVNRELFEARIAQETGDHLKADCNATSPKTISLTLKVEQAGQLSLSREELTLPPSIEQETRPQHAPPAEVSSEPRRCAPEQPARCSPCYAGEKARTSSSSSPQRHSDTTEDGSDPFSSGWRSQVTSTATTTPTTDRQGLSPRTDGTSVASLKSLEPSSTASGTTVAEQDCPRGMPTKKGHMTSRKLLTDVADNGKSLKKKPSRFKMNAFTFFRKCPKALSSHIPAADTAGLATP